MLPGCQGFPVGLTLASILLKGEDMTNRFDELLALIVQEYFRDKYKGIVHTETYTRESLLECMAAVTDQVMYNHCIEDRVAMHQLDDQYRKWYAKNVDIKAQQEVDLKLSLHKPFRNPHRDVKK